jgi:hypothetical protein
MTMKKLTTAPVPRVSGAPRLCALDGCDQDISRMRRGTTYCSDRCRKAKTASSYRQARRVEERETNTPGAKLYRRMRAAEEAWILATSDRRQELREAYEAAKRELDEYRRQEEQRDREFRVKTLCASKPPRRAQLNGIGSPFKGKARRLACPSEDFRIDSRHCHNLPTVLLHALRLSAISPNPLKEPSLARDLRVKKSSAIRLPRTRPGAP